MASILGENIKKYRKSSNLTIRELSDKANVGSSTISQIENGKRKSLSSQTIQKISKALGVDVNELFSSNAGVYKVTDLDTRIKTILIDNEVFIDDIVMTNEEKEQFLFAIQLTINTIRNNRKKGVK